MRFTRGLSCAILSLILLAAPAAALKPVHGYPVTPADFGIVFQRVTITTPDSLKLKGWFYPAQDTTGIATHLFGHRPVPPGLKVKERPYDPAQPVPRPTVIICDGDAGNMADGIFYAYMLFTHGYNVLTFDWRGFGESDPWPRPQDLLVCPEFLTDYRAAIAYVCARPETQGKRVGLYGSSTGAYLSFAMLASRDEVAAMAGRAMPSSFEDLLPVIAPLDTTRHFYAPQDYPLELLPANAAPRVTKPILLIVGENDVRTPVWMSQKVYDSVKGPRELWIVPGAGHGGRTAPEAVAWDEFWARINAFFDKYLAGPGETD